MSDAAGAARYDFKTEIPHCGTIRQHMALLAHNGKVWKQRAANWQQAESIWLIENGWLALAAGLKTTCHLFTLSRNAHGPTDTSTQAKWVF